MAVSPPCCRTPGCNHAGSAILKRHHRFLIIRVKAEDHKPAHVAARQKLRGTDGRRWVRFRRGTFHNQSRPAARVWLTEEAALRFRCWFADSRLESRVGCHCRRGSSVETAPGFPVFRSLGVICQPLPVAIWAILPPRVPPVTNAGMVVRALFGGVKSIPRTLICPALTRLSRFDGAARGDSDRVLYRRHE